jgi:O-antigen ligase
MIFNSSIEEFFFKKFPSFLIILIPITLISGPFLSDLSVVLVTILFITFIIKYNKYYLLNNLFTKIFLIFWIYILFNSLIINFDLTSLKISFFYFRFLFFSLAISYLLEINEKLLKTLFFSFLFCFILLIFDGYFQYFFGQNILGMKIAYGPRVSSFFGDELILGSYLSRLFPIFFGLTIFLYKKDLRKIILISSIFILLEGLVFISGERVAFFYINLSAFFIIILINKFKLLRFVTLLLSFLLIFTIINFNDSAKTRVIDLTIEQLGFTKKDSKKYIFSEEHQDHYMTAINMFKDKPFFGVGIKNFRNKCSDKKYISGNYPCSSHPHNIYIQLLSETGFFGFIILVIIFILICIRLIKHFFYQLKKKTYFSDFQICMLSAIFITIWPIAPNGNLFNNWLSIIYYLPVGIFLWSLKLKKNLKN